MNKILLIEDDPLLREMFQTKLQTDLNSEVRTAASGKEAIGLLNGGEAFQLIVSDYSMKDGTGLDVLEFLETTGLSIPFYLYTSSVDLEVNTQYRHFKGTIYKFNYAELVQNVLATFAALSE